MKHRPVTALFVIFLLMGVAPGLAFAQQLPAAVGKYISEPLDKVGDGTYRKLGFDIYTATLWAPGGKFVKSNPYALQLDYARSLSQKTLSDALIDDIRAQGVADEQTLRRWQNVLKNSLPAVVKGDEIIALSLPGKGSIIYFNGNELVRIEDAAFSTAFFNIWFGPKADETLYSELVGN